MKKKDIFDKSKTTPLFLVILIFLMQLYACSVDMHVVNDDFYSRRIINEPLAKEYSSGIIFKYHHRKSSAFWRGRNEKDIVTTTIVRGTEQHSNELIELYPLSALLSPVFQQVSLTSRGAFNETAERCNIPESKMTKKLEEVTVIKLISCEQVRPDDDNINKEKKKAKDDKGGGMSIVSFLTGIMGLLVLGFFLGIVAIVFGSMSILQHKKLKALAIMGLIIGIFDFFVMLLYMADH